MRISDWAIKFGIQVIPYNAKPGEMVNRVIDIFTTRDGSWEPSDKPGSVPQWARDAYLKPLNHPQYNDDGGADHHIFGAVMQDGNLYPSYNIEYYTWSDGRNRTTQQTKRHGWANVVMYSSSNFVPERGERGPWAWKPSGIPADIVTGAGLPANQHVSFWAVWKPEVAPVTPPVEVPPVSNTVLTQLARVRQELNILEDLLKDTAT